MVHMQNGSSLEEDRYQSRNVDRNLDGAAQGALSSTAQPIRVKHSGSAGSG